MKDVCGYSLSMDLKGCDTAITRSREKIQEYVIQLCKLLDVQRFGDFKILNLGEPQKEEYNIFQFTEYGNICGTFDNKFNIIILDLFCRKEFDFNKIVEFSMEFFGSDEVVTHTATRGEGYGT